MRRPCICVLIASSIAAAATVAIALLVSGKAPVRVEDILAAYQKQAEYVGLTIQ